MGYSSYVHLNIRNIYNAMYLLKSGHFTPVKVNENSKTIITMSGTTFDYDYKVRSKLFYDTSRIYIRVFSSYNKNSYEFVTSDNLYLLNEPTYKLTEIIDNNNNILTDIYNTNPAKLISREMLSAPILTNENDNPMTNVNNNNDLMLISTLLMEYKNYVTIKVVYKGSNKHYTFLCHKSVSDKLNIDDTVIVPDVHKNNITGCKVVKIDNDLDINPNASDIKYKPIYGKLDTTEYDKSKFKMNKLFNQVKKKNRKKLIKRVIKGYK